jgi:hypothetical protein
MSQLAPDDDQRDLLVGQLDSVRMAQLMRRKSTPDARCGGGSSQLAARGRLLPSPAGGRTVNHAQQRADGQPDAQLLPGFELLPRPAVHPDLATVVAFAVADKHGAAAGVEVGLGERERLADPHPRPPQKDDQRAQPDTIGARAGGAHHRDDLLHRRRIGGVAPALVARRATGVIARQGHGLAAMASRVKQDRVHRAPPG